MGTWTLALCASTTVMSVAYLIMGEPFRWPDLVVVALSTVLFYLALHGRGR